MWIRSLNEATEPPRARRVVSRGSRRKKLEFHPNSTAKFYISDLSVRIVNMNKNIVIAIVSLAVIGAAAYVVINKEEGKLPVGQKPEASAECIETCAKASAVCPSLNIPGNCSEACDSWSEEVKNKVEQADSCSALSDIPELVASLLPEMNEPKTSPAGGDDCEAACGSYVGKCLTLVPNASEALFADGLKSCKQECAGWNQPKRECMISAFDCEAMTNVCGL